MRWLPLNSSPAYDRLRHHTQLLLFGACIKVLEFQAAAHSAAGSAHMLPVQL
jgi:hypothetical protein